MPTFLSDQLRTMCPNLQFDTTSEWVLLPELPPDCQMPTDQAEWVKYCMAFLFATLSVIGIVGNILVIFVVLKVRGMVSLRLL
ncbi:unnamed protein product [Strongylus vulgaris]|uniref:Uncharacterized protein n=1 Tax=Strongylus vulgaris TaxID=40348 RepID=A0A3P7JSH4_STRVU|nr:unnamed protein product [Strongylus vulgaris]